MAALRGQGRHLLKAKENGFRHHSKHLFSIGKYTVKKHVDRHNSKEVEILRE